LPSLGFCGVIATASSDGGVSVVKNFGGGERPGKCDLAALIGLSAPFAPVVKTKQQSMELAIQRSTQFAEIFGFCGSGKKEFKFIAALLIAWRLS
jgi:hypothetical protein